MQLMMKKHYYTFIVCFALIFGLASCGKSSKSDNTKTADSSKKAEAPKKLETAKKTIGKSYQDCDFKAEKDDCPYMAFDYASVTQASGDQVKEAINKKVLALMGQAAGVKDADEATLTKAADDFVKGFGEAVKSGSVMGTWYTKTNVTVTQNKDIASAMCVSEGYGGGAHGFSSVAVAHFDLNTGKEVTLDDVLTVNYLPEIQKIATKVFRKLNEIPEGKAISDQGYLISDNEKLTLAKSYIFKTDHIEFLYGRYEAGPHSMPPPTLTLKYADIKHLIKKDGLLGHKAK